MQFSRAGAVAALVALAVLPAQAGPLPAAPAPPPAALSDDGRIQAARRARPALPPGAVAFNLNVGGIRLGRLVLETDRDGPLYRTRARFATAGAIASVWKARLDAVAEGHVRPGQWQAKRFEAKTASGSKRQALEIRWQGTTPTGVLAEPPFDPKPWQIDPTAQDGTSDPLSSFVGTLTVDKGTRPCDRSAEIFDGRRRYRVTLDRAEPAGERGLARHCTALFERLAGYKPKQMAKPPIRLKVLYAPHPTGGWRLQRISTGTPFGTAVLVRAAGG